MVIKLQKKTKKKTKLKLKLTINPNYFNFLSKGSHCSN
jgi:hypothetical protein